MNLKINPDHVSFAHIPLSIQNLKISDQGHQVRSFQNNNDPRNGDLPNMNEEEVENDIIDRSAINTSDERNKPQLTPLEESFENCKAHNLINNDSSQVASSMEGDV